MNLTSFIPSFGSVFSTILMALELFAGIAVGLLLGVLFPCNIVGVIIVCAYTLYNSDKLLHVHEDSLRHAIRIQLFLVGTMYCLCSSLYTAELGSYLSLMVTSAIFGIIIAGQFRELRDYNDGQA